jgi:hypothetical protein
VSGVHNTGLSVARILPAEAVEAIGSFIGCGSRKERRERWEATEFASTSAARGGGAIALLALLLYR